MQMQERASLVEFRLLGERENKKKKYFLKPRLFNFLNLEEESQLSHFQNLCGFKVNFNLCSLWLCRQHILAVLAS